MLIYIIHTYKVKINNKYSIHFKNIRINMIYFYLKLCNEKNIFVSLSFKLFLTQL